MNRKYNISEFKSIINKIRNIRPDINITTDLIVGFPEETEECFNETISNLKDIKFSKIHVFPYSIRNNTPAATMKQVNDSIKKERVHKILELSNILEDEYYNKFVGKNLDVLIEEVRDNKSIGHTDNYIKVIIDEIIEHNNIVSVRISEVVKVGVKGIYNN